MFYSFQDMVAQFPGRVIDAELPKLPRPEIGKILASSLFGKKNVFHPALKEKYQNEDLITIMSRIQQHVLKNRLRVNEFFRVSIGFQENVTLKCCIKFISGNCN